MVLVVDESCAMALVASVVIPALNVADCIDGQLAALAAQSQHMAFEVVVADNGSTDETGDHCLAWRDRLDVRVVNAEGRAGVSFARNVGAQAAAAELVLFCDADDLVSDRWVQSMVDALVGDDMVGGPLHLSRVNTPSQIARAQAQDTAELPRALRYLPYATGCNLGVRRDVILALGGFDTSYRGGHEEVDFAWRLQEAGHSIGWTPDAVVHYRLRSGVRALVRQRYHYGRTNAQLQRRFSDRPGMPPATIRRQVRILMSHLRDLPGSLTDRDQLAGWFTGLGWAVGRIVGMIAPLPEEELMPSASSAILPPGGSV